MKKKCLYIVLSFFISVCLHAQTQGQKAIDSLLKDLNSERYNKNDSNRVKQLIRLTWGYMDNGNADTGLQYGEQALNLALKLNWNKGIQYVYGAIAEIYMGKRQHEKAIEYYEKAIVIGKERGDYGPVSSDISNIATIYYQTGDYKKSLQRFFEALKISEEHDYKSNIAHILNGIGLCYKDQGYYPQALEYHLKALNVFVQIGEKKSIAASYIYIANVYLNESDPHTALTNFDSALKIYKGIENIAGIAYSYGSIGNAYEQQQDFDSSLKYFQSALKLSYDSEDKNLSAKMIGNIGKAYYAQHKYSAALEYFEACLKILNEQGDKVGIAESDDLIGDCYIAIMNEEAAGDSKLTTIVSPDKYMAAVKIPSGKADLLRAAFDHYRAGLAISREINALSFMQRAYTGLAAAYKQDNDFKKALDYADSSRSVKDSLFSKENSEKIVRLSMKNEYDKQHFTDSLKNIQNIQSANFKLQKQKWILYSAICIFVLVVVSVVFLQRAKTAKAKTEQQALFSRQLLDVELRALRAQMNPHFIFNSLNSIQAFILRENKTEAVDYLQKFSRLIRMILDNSQKTSNTIEEEVEILGLYMDIEKLRLKK